MKRVQARNLAQLIQCVFVPAGYLVMMIYTVYQVRYAISREHADHDDDDESPYGAIKYVRAWLLIEIYYFFNWIFGSVLFIAAAYLIKFKPISKHEDVADNDDDIWNDKDRDDFLHYLKQEYFLLTYYITNILTELMFGFSSFDLLDTFGWEDPENGVIRAWYPTKTIFLLLITSNVGMLAGYII